MAQFLVEVYQSRANAAPGVPVADAARAAAAGAAPRLAGLPGGETKGAHIVGSIFAAEDETCFYLFEADSADAVHQETARLGWQYERVVEVVAEYQASASSREVPPTPTS